MSGLFGPDRNCLKANSLVRLGEVISRQMLSADTRIPLQPKSCPILWQDVNSA